MWIFSKDGRSTRIYSGPLLFLLYINDLPFYAKNLCDIVLFADDISLIFKLDRNKTNYDEVNSALSHIFYWFYMKNLWAMAAWRC